MSNMAFISPASDQNGLAFTHFDAVSIPRRRGEGWRNADSIIISMQSFHELL